MAGSSSADEDNYWPGYVDALTTMVMVLTFIMMVLGITIFTMSQTVSRSHLEAIALAAGLTIDPGAGPGTDRGSLDILKGRIIAALEAKLQANVNSNWTGRSSPSSELLPDAIGTAPSDAADRTDDPEAVDVQDVEHKFATTLAAAPDKSAAGPASQIVSPLDAVAAKGGVQVGPDPNAKASPVLSAPLEAKQQAVASDAGAPEASNPLIHSEVVAGNAPPAPASATQQRVDSAAEALKEIPKPAAVSAVGPLLTVTYKPRATRLDDEAMAEVRKFLISPALKTPAMNFVVKSYVPPGGAVTEARRTAYYRSMLVRQLLVESGVAANQIQVRIEDSSDAKKSDVTHVFEK